MKNRFINMLTISFTCFFIFFVVHEAYNLSRAKENILKSPNVKDVTSVIQTRVLATSEDYPTNGEWVKKDFNDNSWTPIKIPSRKLVNEKGYSNNSFAYYRIVIPKDAFKDFMHLKGEISFALQYVLFDRVDIIVNGNFVKTTSNPQNAVEYMQVIPVPLNEEIVVALKGFIKTPVDTGIDHRGEILVGKTSELNDLYVAGFKRHTAFQLVFILCKGSILLIFALIFLILNVETSFVKFFAFGLCTLFEELIAGDYLNPFIPFKFQIFIYNTVNIGGTFFVFLFFEELLRSQAGRKKVFIITTLLTIVSSLIAADALYRNFVFDIGSWMKFWNVMTVLVMAFFVPKAFRKDKTLFTVLLVVIGLYLWGIAPSNNIGLNFKRYGNLLLFVMVAYQTFIIFSREQELLKLKEKQLLEQEKDVVMGKTASLLAHDIRKPLEQIKLVFEKLNSGEADKNFIEIAKKDIDYSMESVLQQVNNMMNYSKNTELSLEEVSFYKVLFHCIKQVMSVHQEMNLELAYALDADRKIWGDEARLGGILTNLISNAVEAIRDIGNRYNGKIKFSTYIEGDQFIFKIFNDGPEIPKEHIKQIFKPLFTHGKPNGTGFGLASVFKAIREVRGQMKVENVPYEGVAFTLAFQLNDNEDSIKGFKFLSSSKLYGYKELESENVLKEEIRIFVFESDPSYIASRLEFDFPDAKICFADDVISAQSLIEKMRFDLYYLNITNSGYDKIKSKLSFINDGLILYDKANDLPDPSSEIKKVKEANVRILFVDDTKLFRIAWELFHGSHNIKCVSSPEEALLIISDAHCSFDVFVLDYHFINSSMNGEGLAKKILEIRPQARIFISSNAKNENDDFQSISKSDYEIRKYLF